MQHRRSAPSERKWDRQCPGEILHAKGRILRKYLEALYKILNRLKIATCGVAAIEFALLSPLMLIILSGLANLGVATLVKIQINTAISSAEYYAFETGQGITSNKAADFANKLKSLVGAQLTGQGTFTVSVLYNGSTDAAAIDAYYCVSGTEPGTFIISGRKQSDCAQNLTSGKYVTIKVAGQINAPIPFSSFMGSIMNVSETTYVRIR